MYDILNNYKFGYFQQASADGAGAAANAPDDDGVDLWTANQYPNRVLAIIDVGAIASGGTLTLIFQDSSDQTTWDVDFLTCAAITATGLYLVEIFDPNRYLRCNATVGTNTVTWSGLYMTYENQRRPVTQIATTIVPTYGTGRKPKVSAT